MFSLKKAAFWAIIGFCIYYFAKMWHVGPVPVLRDDVWWGPGQPIEQSGSIRPFKIQIPTEVINDLHERLDKFLKMKKTPPLENSHFLYGFNSKYLQTVVEYWRHQYNWSSREKYLNQYPQYKTYINGLDLHFIHIVPEKTSGKKVLPLLLLHGWPGSVREFYDMIPFLTRVRSDADFVFELVIPSLPGYGFSQGSSKPGLGSVQMAVVMKNLMKRLGFDSFYVQGGDWGAQIAKNMGILYPKKILGIHSNMCFTVTPKTLLLWGLGSWLPFLAVEENHYSKMYPLLPKIQFTLNEMGYLHIQASKPDTVGTALEDSPAGLAAYILEKFSTWTNRNWIHLDDGGLTKKFTLDTLLDNVMIYWVTRSITTSMRLYAETFNKTEMELNMDRLPLQVPITCARFPNEPLWMSKYLVADVFKKLEQVSDFEDGGHFPGLEVPKIISEDIWKAVKVFRERKT